MAEQKHKTASEVTVASLNETGMLQKVVQQYWMPAAGVAAVMTGVILFRQYQAQSEETARMAEWDEYGAVVSMDPKTGAPFGDPVALQSAATRLVDQPVSAYLRMTEVLSRRQQGDWAGAQTALDALKSEHPDSTYASQMVTLEDGTTRSLVDQLAATIAAGQAWDAGTSDTFSNPPLPEDAPRVKIETTAGDLVLGLYSNRAPLHVANFLALCDDGTYVGTKFHRIGVDFMIQGGDPNSKQDEDKSTWGQGGEGDQIDPEPNDLLHFEGVLAAAKKSGETKSSPSQFYITTGTPHHLDGLHTIFGTLLEGADIAETISLAELETGTDRPAEPVEILSTTRL